MSQWTGFDQRKVCPNCGGYQTSFGKSNRTAGSRKTRALLVAVIVITLFLLIFSIFIIRAKGVTPKLSLFVGLFLTVCWGLGSIVGYYLPSRRQKRDLSADLKSQSEQSIVYHLSCMNCGYNWEMSPDEWETAGKQELENLPNSPAARSKSDSGEFFEKIEWKPPDTSRGILIVVSFVALGIIVSLSGYAVFWSLSHPKHSYASVINVLAIFLLWLVYVGLTSVIRPRANRIIPMILITLILLIGSMLTFLLK